MGGWFHFQSELDTAPLWVLPPHGVTNPPRLIWSRSAHALFTKCLFLGKPHSPVGGAGEGGAGQPGALPAGPTCPVSEPGGATNRPHPPRGHGREYSFLLFRSTAFQSLLLLSARGSSQGTSWESRHLVSGPRSATGARVTCAKAAGRRKRLWLT